MIRFLEDREKLNITPLYEETFVEDTPEYKEYFYEEIVPNNQIAVDIEGNDIRGMISLIPKSVMVGKSKEHCYYIYGVATQSKYRNKGIMKELMKEVVQSLHANGELFTYLIPSTETNGDIYEKLGFAYVMNKSCRKKKELRKKPTHSLVLRKADTSDYARLAIFAQSMMSERFGIYLTKDKEYFKNMFSLMEAEGGKVELYFENKIVLGYRIGFEDEIIEEVLDERISELSYVENNVKPFAMARLLNIRPVLSKLPTADRGSVVIRVIDDIVEDNNDTFLWRYDKGHQSFEKTKMEPEVVVTIGELTAHVFGYREYTGLPKMAANNGFFINDYV